MESWVPERVIYTTKDAVVFNTESLFHYYMDKDYREYVNCVDMILIDGIGLKLVLLLFGCRVKRYNGPDFLKDTLQNTPMPIYIFGGPKNRATAKYGEIKVELPFSDNLLLLSNKIAAYINQNIKSECLVFLSLGLPKQEKTALLLRKNYPKQRIKILPVGAAVDYVYGVKARSSKFWRIIGLEWLPRLIREPRMIKRVFLSIMGIIYFCIDYRCDA
jgi:N-acetylglucosaminyldiphosphoundecaprenol N-acetyl-beta-D-mannosaminyltransferase